MNKKVIKNGSLYILGNIFNKAISFITVPIFARLLTTEEYGIASTYFSWITLLSVVIGLSLSSSIRNAIIDMSEELGKYISSIFTLASLNFGIICIIVAVVINKISIPHPLIWMCIIEGFFNFIVNSIIFKYMMEEEAKKRTLLMVLPNLMGALLAIALISVMENDKYYGRVGATCFVTSAFGLSILLYYFIKYRTFVNLKYWKYAIPISIPLIFHGISNVVLGAADRSIITYYCGASDTGIYSLIYNLSMASVVITSSAESVWIPRMTKNLYDKDYRTFHHELLVYIYGVEFVFCGLLTISPELVRYIGGVEYMSGFDMVFPIFASAFVLFAYTIYVNVEYFHKKTKMIATATIIAAILNIILNFIFIPLYGSVAAAYTTLVSYIVSFILHSRDAMKIDKEAVPYKIFIIPAIIILVTGVIVSLTKDLIVLRYMIMLFTGTVYAFIILKVVVKRKYMKF